jgi:hypothetical protein
MEQPSKELRAVLVPCAQLRTTDPAPLAWYRNKQFVTRLPS